VRLDLSPLCPYPDPMTQPLLVFDLDGTLAETAPDLVATLNKVLADIGLGPVDYHSARTMVGGGARLMIERALAQAGVTLPKAKIDQMFDDFLVHYDAHIADASTLFPGVITALDRFEDDGWRLAVCTNKITASSVLLLKALGVADRFAAICGKDSFPISKPDASALLKTIEKAGGDRNRTIMVGDSKTDIETAQNANVPVIAVDFGYTDQHVSAYKPNRVISHFDDLWDAVADIAAGAKINRASNAAP
jgi:phosphoglycolate phosphatase